MMEKLNGCIFLNEGDDLLKKYNTNWDKVSTDIKKEFDRKSVCNKEFLKTKSRGDEVTDFYNKEIPKVDSNHTCLALINLDSDRNQENFTIKEIFHNQGNFLLS